MLGLLGKYTSSIEHACHHAMMHLSDQLPFVTPQALPPQEALDWQVCLAVADDLRQVLQTTKPRCAAQVQ